MRRYLGRAVVVTSGAMLLASACATTSPDVTVEAQDASVDASAPGAPADASRAVDAAEPTGDAATPEDDAATPELDAAPPVEVDASVPDAAAPDAGLACHGLTQLGSVVDAVDRVQALDRTPFTGGPIADGVYVLTAVTSYVEPSHVDGSRFAYGAETIAVHGEVLDSVFVHPTGETIRFEATLARTGGRIAMTPTCTWSTDVHAYLPVLWDWAPLVHEECGYVTTPTTLTVWVPRGNHAQVVRVYTKRE